MSLRFFCDQCVPMEVTRRRRISLQLHNHPEILAKLLDRLIAYTVVHTDPTEYECRLFLVEAHRIRIRS